MMALALWVGASAIAGRPLRTQRASACMMEGASIFRQPAFLLGKPDLPVAREVGSVLEQSVATVAPLPETSVAPAALAHVSDVSTTALAATSSSGGGFPLLPVVLVALPALLYFVVLPRLDGGPADASGGEQPRPDGASDNAQALADVEALAEAEARRAEASGESPAMAAAAAAYEAEKARFRAAAANGTGERGVIKADAKGTGKRGVSEEVEARARAKTEARLTAAAAEAAEAEARADAREAAREAAAEAANPQP